MPTDTWKSIERAVCKKLADDEAAPQFVKSAAKGFVSRTTHPPLP